MIDNFSSTEEEDSDDEDKEKDIDFFDDIKVDPEDERALQMFQNKYGDSRRGLVVILILIISSIGMVLKRKHWLI